MARQGRPRGRRRGGGNGADATDPGAGGEAPGLNSAGRDALLQETFEDLYVLDGDIDEAIDEHVRPLREARVKKRRELKAELNMEAEDFDPAYRWFQRRKQVEGFDDRVARD